MKGQLRIDEVFAFIVVDEDGTEGVPALRIDGMVVPMMGADMARVDSLRPYAEEIARRGLAVTLCRFERRTEMFTWPQD